MTKSLVFLIVLTCISCFETRSIDTQEAGAQGPVVSQKAEDSQNQTSDNAEKTPDLNKATEQDDGSFLPPKPPPFDIVLSEEVLFYGINDYDEPLVLDGGIRISKGGRYPFDEWNPYVYDPSKIDVVVELQNTGAHPVQDIDLILSVSPKIGAIKYISSFKEFHDYSATEAGAIWFPAMFVQKQLVSEIERKSSSKITFSEIDIKNLIDQITKAYDLWPAAMKFSVMVLPKLGETDISNNVCKRALKIHMLD